MTVLVASLAYGQDTVALKRIAKEGETTKFKLSVDTEISGMVIKFSADIIEKVSSFGPDGKIKISTEQQNAVLSVGGQDQPAPSGVGDSVISTYNGDGSVSEIQGDNTNSDSYRLANLQSLLYPKDAIGVGSKWELELAENKKNSTPPVKAKYEVLGKETMGTRTVFKVSFDLSETTGSDAASSKGNLWIDIANGLVVKSEAQWKNVPIAGQIIDGKVQMTISE